MDKHDFEEFLQDIKTQRDELNLKMHLAAAELKAEWQHIEDKKLPEIEHKIRTLTENYEEHADELADSVKIIGEEIHSAYDRIKNRLND